MLLYILFGLAVLAEAECMLATGSYNISEDITGLIAIGKQIILSTDTSLLGLTTDLKHGTNFDFGIEYESITGVAAYHSNVNLITIVTCLAPGNMCAIFSPRNSSDLLSSYDLTYMNGINSYLVPLALVPTETSCFVAGFGGDSSKLFSANKIWIAQFFYNEDEGQMNTDSYSFRGNHRREFLDGFEYNNNLYFVARDPNAENGLAIFRTCMEPSLEALYEVNLASVPLTQHSTIVTIQLFQNPSMVSEALLIVTVSNLIGSSEVIAIKMSDVEKKMEMIYDDCLKGGEDEILTPPWAFNANCQPFGAVRILFLCWHGNIGVRL